MGGENVGLFHSRRFELSRNFPVKQWLQRRVVAGGSVAWQPQTTAAREDWENVSLNNNQKPFECIFCAVVLKCLSVCALFYNGMCPWWLFSRLYRVMSSLNCNASSWEDLFRNCVVIVISSREYVPVFCKDCSNIVQEVKWRGESK